MDFSTVFNIICLLNFVVVVAQECSIFFAFIVRMNEDFSLKNFPPYCYLLYWKLFFEEK